MARSKKPQAKSNPRRAPRRASPDEGAVSRGACPESSQPSEQDEIAYTPSAQTAAAGLRTLVRWRVPESAPPEILALADRALGRVSDVLEEKVDKDMAGHVLKAAQTLRDEICGPVPKTVNLNTQLSFQDLARAAAAKEAESK